MMFGGGISLTSTDLPSWVELERKLIRDYVDQGRRVLGICLGSQLLASALGATVKRNPQPEVGWHLVHRVDDPPTAGVAQGLPQQMRVFHWHQDTFGIPDGATWLYRSDACQHQAFVLDDRVFGFQFHFEANERTVKTFLAVSNLWRRQSTSVQSQAEITGGIESHLPDQTLQMKSFLTAPVQPNRVIDRWPSAGIRSSFCIQFSNQNSCKQCWLDPAQTWHYFSDSGADGWTSTS